MRHGIDTDFLVAVEITDHPFHKGANQLLDSLLEEGHNFALAPQTLLEFIHVVTDPNRMPDPLTMREAIGKAKDWWEAKEVLRVFPKDGCVGNFLDWMNQFRLGRKRLLDTMLAATLKEAGVAKILSNNAIDYKVFELFEILRFHGD